MVRGKTIAAGAAVMILVAGATVQKPRRTSDPRAEVIAGTIAVLVCIVPHRVMIAVRTEVVAVAVVQLGTETAVAANVVQFVTGALEGLLLLLSRDH